MDLDRDHLSIYKYIKDDIQFEIGWFNYAAAPDMSTINIFIRNMKMFLNKSHIKSKLKVVNFYFLDNIYGYGYLANGFVVCSFNDRFWINKGLADIKTQKEYLVNNNLVQKKE